MTDITPIPWFCGTCGEPISDGAGAVCAPFAQISNWPDSPSVTWTPLHLACMDPNESVYGVDVEGLRGPAGLRHWSTHLMAKGWMRDSNWPKLMRDALKRRGVAA